MRRRFYGFNNRFRTTKNTEAIVFENGGFVGNLGLSKKLWQIFIILLLSLKIYFLS